MLLLAGCSNREVEESHAGIQEGAGDPQTAVEQAGGGEERDSLESAVGGVEAGEEVLVPSSPLPEGGAEVARVEASPQAARAQDPVEEGNFQDRLDRLEAENDSLRAAVGTLLAFLAGDSERPESAEFRTPPEASQGDSTSAPSDLIRVDAQDVQNWGFRAVVALVFLTLTGLFIRGLIWVLEKLAERNAKRRLFFKRLVPIARISLWFLAILFVSMVIFRVQAQGLIAAGAAVGVAVGFAAQDILKNVFGGLIVLFDQPFQVGDKISVQGTYGEVVSIGLRSTRIVTPDDNLVSVPNAQVVDGQVANANSGELNCQVVTDLFLPGNVDEARAKRIAFEAAASSKYVFLNKPIVVLVKDEFKETFLTHLKVKAYVLDPRLEFQFMSDVTERAREGFRKAGLLGPMHGVRAYLDFAGRPEMKGAGEEHEGPSSGQKEGAE
jgi:small-conductance mechanosensitive channel